MPLLHKPSLEFFQSYMQFISEMREAGETVWDGIIPKVSESPEQFVTRLLASEQTPEPGLVASTTYWAIKQNQVVGRINLRHELNENLKVFGGHVGYEVRPSWRRQGIATQMLQAVLATPRAIAIGRLLITCAPDNIASNKTILANGGILNESKFVEKLNRQTHYYWIESKR